MSFEIAKTAACSAGKNVARFMGNRSASSKRAIGFVLAVMLAKWGIKLAYRRKLRLKIVEKRKEVAERKRQLKERLLQGKPCLMTDQRKVIVEMNYEDLAAQLKNGDLDPLDVLEAYQAKALEVDAELNAVCDFITEAREWALKIRNKPKEERGALYGIPVSIKECYFVKGYDATIGMAKLIGKPCKDDADFVKFIKDQDGIPFCLTNVPQTQLSFACSNPVFGRTLNPWNHSRSPGGSSGGESALLAAGGSILGIGGDVGGSLRIPSHFCGTVSIKPTIGRVFESGRVGAVGTGGEYVRNGLYAVSGFMARSVSGIVISNRILLENARHMSSIDYRVAPIEWQEDLYRPDRKLKIAWYDHDGFYQPTPGCQRAVREVAELLERDGHTVEQWTPPGLPDLTICFWEFLFADKGYYSLRFWEGEELDQALEINVVNHRCPRLLKTMVSPIMGWLSRHMLIAFQAGAEKSRDLWKINALKDKTIYKMSREWEKKGYDVVIGPGFAFPAAPNALCSRLNPGVSYTAAYNISGHPVGILPVTRENDVDQANLADYPVGEDLNYRMAAHATKGATGCPIGVQVIGRHYQEELVLHAMEIIEKLANYQ